MKRRTSSAYRNVHGPAARDSAARAYARGLKAEQPEPPFTVDMDQLIAGLQFADPINVVEIRKALEHYATTNPLGFFLKRAIEQTIDAPRQYAEEQNQLAAGAQQ